MTHMLGSYSISYDRPVELYLEKGNTNRKIRYLSLYKSNNHNNQFYVDEENEPIVAIRDIYGPGSVSKVKLIQHFGIRRN